MITKANKKRIKRIFLSGISLNIFNIEVIITRNRPSIEEIKKRG
jgi:endonuclease V-like protein UPF0215 family